MAYSIEKVESSDGFVTFMENVIQQLKDSIYTDTILLKSNAQYQEVKKITPVYDEKGNFKLFTIECEDFTVSYSVSSLHDLLNNLVATELSDDELKKFS